MKTGNSDILKFFLQLKQNSGSLWLEEDKLKVSVPKELASEQTKNFLTENKAEILKLLKLNNIKTSIDFLSKTILKLSDQKNYKLSFAQDRLLFIDQYEQGTNAYNIPILLKLKNNTNKDLIINSLKKIIAENEILRTVYKETAGEFYQDITETVPEINEFSVNNKSEFDSILKKLINYKFRLTEEIPTKIELLIFKNEIYILIVIHHIAFDGWSSELFLNELERNYFEFKNSTDQLFNNSTTTLQYKDYSEWQSSYLSGKTLELQLNYWKNYLREYENLKLPIDKERPAKLKYDGKDYIFELDEITSSKIKEIASANKTTVFGVLLSAYYLFLNKYTNQEDIVVGTPISNRHFEETKNIMGFFVNTLPLRIKIEDNDTITEIIQKTAKDLSCLQAYQDIPFEKIVSELKIEKDTSRNPVFQSLFSIAEFESKTEYSLFTCIDIIDFFKVAKFDLSLNIDISKKKFIVNFNYSTSLFNEDTILRMSQHLLNILRIITEKNKKVKEICILSPEEFQTIVYDWNKTEAPYPSDKTIHQLFEEQVEKTPDNIAIVFEDKKLTYRELNNRANQLAHTIRKEYKYHWNLEVQPDTLIGIFIDRSLEMIISILAILKAGAAYVPFDKSDPEERLKFKINDCGCKMILTSSSMVEGLVFLTESDTLPVSIDSYWKEISKAPISNPVNINKPNDLAYVIYTSGSTGNPKGTMIEHNSVVNLISSIKSLYDINENQKRVTQFTSCNWDVSVSEIFAAISKGGELYILPASLRQDTLKLSSYIDKIQVNYIYLPPALLSLMPHNQHKSIKKIIYAGEPCSKEGGKYWAENFELYNYFGPTETTIYSTGYKIVNNNFDLIGKPISNVYNYILDNNLNPVPVSVLGELYIGGHGVARGYLNNKDLTTKNFIKNPFIKNDILYKTGDICKLHKDGNIEFIGRNDSQIKINGFRIELKEIEIKILEFGVNSCLILPYYNETTSTKVLTTYYTIRSEELKHEIKGDKNLYEKELKEYLYSKLPKYMVPNIFIRIDKVPLNTSGKIDKKALPKPYFSSSENSNNSPQTDTEKHLAAIWQEVLGVERIGVDDNFFNLGGNSILAIKLSYKISELFNRQFNISDIFTYNTIRKITSFQKQQILINIPNYNIPEAELSFEQERLYFLYEFQNKKGIEYNMPFAFELIGEINYNILISSINKLITRHSIFRTIFVNNDGKIFQKVLPFHEQNFYIEEINKNYLSTIIIEESNYIFNLNEKPPIKFRILKANNDTYFLFNMHHIISDGWSIGILIAELTEIYNTLLYNKPLNLAELSIQYIDFSIWQRDYYQKNILSNQLAYWKDKLYNFEELNMPLDKLRPPIQSFKGKHYNFTLEKELSLILFNFSKNNNITVFQLLFSAFNILLSKHSQQDDILSGIVVANRNSKQVENLIGFFANTLPIRTKISTEQNINEYLEQLNKTCNEAFSNQSIPFEYLINKLELERNTSHMPLIQNIFVFQDKNISNFNFDKISSFPIKLDLNFAKFDLQFFASENIDNCIEFNIEYNTDVYLSSTIDRISKHYKNILYNILRNPHIKIKDIQLLTPEEFQIIVYDWNRTEAPYPSDKTIHQLFEEQVEKTPDNIAVVFEDKKLTYRELNNRVNQLAHTIRKEYKYHWDLEVQPDTLIGIYIDRSLEMIIGILAILKAGAAYVPFDKADPEERLKFKINDCGCKMILTSSGMVEGLVFLTESDTLPVSIDSYWKEVSKAPTSNPVNINKSKDLAYVIYTSGSTGNPKGSLIEHTSLVNRLIWMKDEYNFNVKDNILQKTPYSFDVSVWELILPYLCGATLVFAKPEGHKDPEYLANLIDKEKITKLHFVPSMLSVFIDYLSNIKKYDLTSITDIICSGEALFTDLAYKTKKQLPNIKIHNLYGPTEATIDVSYHEFKTEKDQSFSIPIGKPIQNYQLYILDQFLNPVPIGVPGELFISGIGLARGYHNKKELTDERFILNPFIKDSKMYKTGDLCKWLNTGEIEYLRRNDNQIKINGIRIELDEIQSSLNKHPDIKQSLIVPDVNKNYLLAYYILKSKVDSSEFLSTWESLYDSEYKKSEKLKKINKDYTTWISSYTGKPIPEKEMDDWCEEAIIKILDLNPKTVFEIGSGSGLLMFPLLDKIEKYYGIDFSKTIINTIKIRAKDYLNTKVFLEHAAAHELDKVTFLKNKPNIDTIIMNSVIQYFPDINYLTDVIKESIKIINKGSIFIGDIRDYRLQKEFYLSIEMYRNDKLSSEEILNRIKIKEIKEKELLVSPLYFHELKKQFKSISNIEIIPKYNNNINEMTKFRYDVIIHINKDAKELENINWFNYSNKIDFETLFKLNDNFIITNYPNKNNFYLTEILNNNFKVSKDKFNKELFSINELYLKAKKFNYKLKASVSLTEKTSYDLIFYKKTYNFLNPFLNIVKKHKAEELSNNPNKSFNSNLSIEFKNFLSLKLPEYMIPAFYISLNSFPLNTNGKIDIKALPKPSENLNNEKIIPPQNEYEGKLLEIWKNILGLKSISTESDFFSLGGNSILAIKLIHLANNDSLFNLKLTDIFKNKTIKNICKNCLNTQKNLFIDEGEI